MPTLIHAIVMLGSEMSSVQESSQCSISRKKRALCFGLALLILPVLVETAAACDLNGKSISTIMNICLATGCTQSHQRILIVGTKVLVHDETPQAGRIFHIGRTIEATADPEQRASSTLTPLPGAQFYRVLLTASYNANILILKAEETALFPGKPAPDVVTVTETYVVSGCNACSGDYLFDARLGNGRRETKRGIVSHCAMGGVR